LEMDPKVLMVNPFKFLVGKLRDLYQFKYPKK